MQQTESPARFVWEAIRDGRTELHQALDWLREQTDVEDIAQLKLTIYNAAADELQEREKPELGFDHIPEQWCSSNCIEAIRIADWKKVQVCVWNLFDLLSQGKYKQWWTDALSYYSLCREIEEFQNAP